MSHYYECSVCTSISAWQMEQSLTVQSQFQGACSGGNPTAQAEALAQDLWSL